MKLAIVGTGIAGLGAAHRLHPRHTLTLYEKQNRVGGHSNTVDIDYDGVPMSVDTGFIVFNGRNYPLLTGLFTDLQVPLESTDMSFGVSLGGGAFEWCGHSLDTLFTQRKNAVSPRFLRMLIDINTFFKAARRDLDRDTIGRRSLGDYLSDLTVGETFRSGFVQPMGAAIWSMPKARVLDFPAQSFIRFFENHRLLGFERPRWQTVTGGSRVYVDRLTAPFRDRIRVGCGAVSVTRTDDGVAVRDSAGGVDTYDRVLLACHSDEALALLGDADRDEQAILGAIGFAPNTAFLHRDPALMPRRRKAWAAWSVLESAPDAPVCVSYWMNALQNLDPARPLFVTLNPATPPRDDLTFARMVYDHPQYDGPAVLAQERLSTIQGRRKVWFAGAWCGYGFHEDGLRAGYAAADGIEADALEALS
ncbi:MAG: NAD(P)/FAD-dependent oxidoreductase [Alphaproteobacteria bacterium]